MLKYNVGFRWSGGKGYPRSILPPKGNLKWHPRVEINFGGGGMIFTDLSLMLSLAKTSMRTDYFMSVLLSLKYDSSFL